MSGIIAAAGITAAAAMGSAAMSSGMLGGGKGSGGTQTQQTNSQLPGWVNDVSMQNWDMAAQAANQLMSPYGGQRVAGMTPEMQSLIQQLYGNVGSTNAAFGQAGATTNQLMGYNPSMVTPQMLRDTNLQPYMDPYSGMVINPAMQQMEAARKQSLMQIGDQATQNKAFGGSRQGITEGVQNAASELQRGQFVGGLLGQNFAQAQAAATGDINRDFTGQQFNSQQGLAGAQFRGSMAQQLAGLSQAQQQNFLSGIQAAMGGQGLLQQQSQQELDAARQYYMEQRQQPLDVLAIRQNALSQSPYGQTSYATGPGPSSNPMLSGLGAGATAAGILGQFGMFNRSPTNTSGYSYPSPAQSSMYPELGPMFGSPTSSDRRLKTDIRKIGRDRATDIDLYSYRYRGDPKSYKKVVGPMAQDIRRKYPEAVSEIGGKLAINTNALSMQIGPEGMRNLGLAA